MKAIPVILARILLALPLIVFGLNGFLGFIQPPKMTPEGEAFLKALINTGYMLQFWKGTEVVCGVAILLNLFTPIALVVLTPVMLNIIAFHLFLDPDPQVMGLVAVMVVCQVYLTVKNWTAFKPVLVRKIPKGVGGATQA